MKDFFDTWKFKILVAVAVASLCAFFQRNLGRTIVLAVIYLLYEAAFLIIAYAATVRMEPGYLLPALIRAASGVLLCSLLLPSAVPLIGALMIACR